MKLSAVSELSSSCCSFRKQDACQGERAAGVWQQLAKRQVGVASAEHGGPVQAGGRVEGEKRPKTVRPDSFHNFCSVAIVVMFFFFLNSVSFVFVDPPEPTQSGTTTGHWSPRATTASSTAAPARRRKANPKSNSKSFLLPPKPELRLLLHLLRGKKLHPKR